MRSIVALVLISAVSLQAFGQSVPVGSPSRGVSPGIGAAAGRSTDLAPAILPVDAVTSATTPDEGSQDVKPIYARPGIHRMLGYATLGGALLTGLLGWLAPGEVHGAVAVATTGLAAVTTGVGIAAFGRGELPLGHVILSGLGTLGFAANLFLEAEDDDEGGEGSADLHRWVGTSAAGAFGLSVVWVIALPR